MQLVVHIRIVLMKVGPPDDFFNPGAFMHDLHDIMMIVFSFDRDPLGMRV
jgi:hypothetical protein